MVHTKVQKKMQGQDVVHLAIELVDQILLMYLWVFRPISQPFVKLILIFVFVSKCGEKVANGRADVLTLHDCSVFVMKIWGRLGGVWTVLITCAVQRQLMQH